MFVRHRDNPNNEKFLDLIIFRDYRNIEKPVVTIWRGKQSKPYYNYYLQNIDKAEARITHEKECAEKKNLNKIKEAEERKSILKNYVCSFKVGDILSASWGYDQTNVDFYQVLSVKNKTVEIQEIGQNITGDGFMSGQTSPDPSKKFGNVLKKSVCISTYGNGIVHESVKINSSVRLTKFTGDSTYVSWYG